MKPLTVVIDTNVVVAGLLTKDTNFPTARILDGMRRGEFPFLLSPALLTEYREVLLRRKISSLHGLSEPEVDFLLTELTANAIIREPSHRDGSPDANHAHVWSLVQSGTNCVLVAGDKLLLVHRQPPCKVVSPRQFLELIEK